MATAPAAAWSQITARLGVARLLLGVQGADHEADSAVQAAATIDLLGGLPALGDAQVLEAAEMSGSVRWAKDDGKRVAEALFAKSGSMLAKKRMRKEQSRMQDYQAFPNYLQQADWDVLMNKSSSFAVKKCRLLNKMVLRLHASLMHIQHASTGKPRRARTRGRANA